MLLFPRGTACGVSAACVGRDCDLRRDLPEPDTGGACTEDEAAEEEISFHDRLQGNYTENLARDCGDFIVRRSDGVYAYQLAVVTDDAEGGVTEVVRGRDLLPSSPRQIWLQRTLGFPEPEYCHVPLLVAPDGRRLSKRERDLDLGALRQLYTPEQLIGKLAALANLQPEAAPVRAWELVSRFSWDCVPCDNIEIYSEFG